MNRMRRHWTRFWFCPAEATDLAVARIVFFAGLLLLTRDMESAAWARFGEQFWFPIPLFRSLEVPFPDAEILTALDGLWGLSLVLCALGVATRPSSIVAFLVGFYLLGIPHNFGKLHHSDAIVILTLGILAVSRCGDHLTLPQAWRALRGRKPQQPLPTGEYTWPLRMVQVLLMLVFFGAGLSKLRNSGLDWIVTDNFRNLLLKHHYTHQPLVDWGLALAKVQWICMAVAGITVVVELAAPLALFSKWMRRLLVPSLFGMQLGIWLVLGVFFRAFFLLYVFWIPWNEIWNRLRDARGSAQRECPAP